MTCEYAFHNLNKLQMKIMKNLNLKQLCEDEMVLVAGASEDGCSCKCADIDEYAFLIDCAPNIDYCEYVCKEMLFETVKVKECSTKCDASSFHGRYPDALAWMKKKKKEYPDEEL